MGNLTELIHYDEWGLSGYNTEYKLKEGKDFSILEYVLQDEQWYWDQEAYEVDNTRVSLRGIPQFYFRRSPIQGLFMEHRESADLISGNPSVCSLNEFPIDPRLIKLRVSYQGKETTT